MTKCEIEIGLFGLRRKRGQLPLYKLVVTHPISGDVFLRVLCAELLCLSKPRLSLRKPRASLTPYSPGALSDLHQSTHYGIISSRVSLRWTGIPRRVPWIRLIRSISRPVIAH